MHGRQKWIGITQLAIASMMMTMHLQQSSLVKQMKYKLGRWMCVHAFLTRFSDFVDLFALGMA